MEGTDRPAEGGHEWSEHRRAEHVSEVGEGHTGDAERADWVEEEGTEAEREQAPRRLYSEGQAHLDYGVSPRGEQYGYRVGKGRP
jgi:hypothetical protein